MTPTEVETIKEKLTTQAVPVLDALSGERDAGAYSNEADAREPNWRTTFFGTNYPRLKQVKRRYDPEGLFIVTAGVASEDWDRDARCRL